MTFEQSRIGPLVVGNYTVPAPINRFLRPYQREGVEFLLTQYKNGIGGILGDDMGLGKTIQVIAFLSALMSSSSHLDLQQELSSLTPLLLSRANWQERRRQRQTTKPAHGD